MSANKFNFLIQAEEKTRVNIKCIHSRTHKQIEEKPVESICLTAINRSFFA